MKKIIIPAASILLLTLAACKGSENSSSDNDVDAARNFIQAALNGDFDKARTYMVNDSLNQEDLDNVIRLSQRLTPDEKTKYREASIRIHDARVINDSTSMVIYSNSYKNRQDSLKVVRINKQWLVDFKYIFKHATDTLQR